MSRRVTDTIALKKAMVDSGLDKIIDLSRASGVSRNTLGNILNGNSQPSADVMNKLVVTLEVPPSEAGQIFFSSILRNA